MPTSNPQGGVLPRAAGAPGGAEAGAYPSQDSWYAEGGQVFDNLYLLTTKMNSAWAVNTSVAIILIDTCSVTSHRMKLWMEVRGLNGEGVDGLWIRSRHRERPTAKPNSRQRQGKACRIRNWLSFAGILAAVRRSGK
jgi:hypothetical protein